MMNFCNYCAKRCPTVRGDEGFICCTICGRVIDSDMFSNELTFIKSAGGQSQLSGKFVKSVDSGFSESHERTLMKGRDEISYLVENLNIEGGNSIIDQASAFYKIAVDRNFTRGRRTSLVAAACLYIACREKTKPFLLIDFSEELRVNVYVLGAVFLQLCKLLRLEEHPIVQKLVDPSLFIHRFTDSLLRDSNVDVSDVQYVSRTALRILASMKRDWMQTGRKPSGLCGAALYISAHSYGVKCSKSDIGSVVHICEATLTKRLIEFENTESGSLTIEEFNTKAIELEKESGSIQVASKSCGEMKLLCEHKNSERPHFAHGLCKGCYDDFVELSGGLQGGSDPPAFQRAERERLAKISTTEKADTDTGGSDPSAFQRAEREGLGKVSTAEKTKDMDMCAEEMDSLSQPNQDLNVTGKMDTQWSTGLSGISESQAFEEGVAGSSDGKKEMDANGEAESLSDIDDVEVNAYLHDEDEKRLKKIIWESLNREYLEEEAAKQKAKEAHEAILRNCPEEFVAAQELAAAAAEAVAKSRKERRQKRASEAKNAGPAHTAAEAARQMLTKKKLSSKINYDVLDKLFDDSTDTKDAKKRRVGSDDNDGADQQQHIGGKKESESDLGDFKSNFGQEYGYEEELTAGGMYGEDLYPGYEEEEYGYEDYGYEF